MHVQDRGSRSRRSTPLTREVIIDAALAVVDQEGLPALNMRRLGAALDVEAMAVYRHFPNKAAILDGVVAAVLHDLAESVGSDDWRQAFRTTFRSLRAILRAHPNALPLVASRPLASPQLTRRLESTRDLLLQSLREEDVLCLLHSGLSLTLGYLWLEAGGFVGELPDEAPFLKATAQPTQPASGSPVSLAASWSPDQDFAGGLELLMSEPSAR
jgi:AcrR family transcriptional regulator